MTVNVEAGEVVGVTGPLLPTQFKTIWQDVERVFTAAPNPTDLMSFGHSIMDQTGAIEEGFIREADEFRPMLRGASINGLCITLDGAEYEKVSLFFKQGGNKAADPEWLGDITFRNKTTSLEYTFRRDGRIKMEKRTTESRWVATCWAQAQEGQELISGLGTMKKQLHAQKLAQGALSA